MIINWEMYFILSLFFLAMIAFVIIFYRHIARSSEAAREQAVLKSQIMPFDTHISTLIHSNDVIRKFRHDFNHHITVILGMLINKECERAIAYLKNISDLPENAVSPISGNIVVDAVLQAMRSQAEEKSIMMHINSLLLKTPRISDGDLCVLVSNAIQNAIDACEKINNAPRTIGINLRAMDSSFIFTVENSINEPSININIGEKLDIKTG